MSDKLAEQFVETKSKLQNGIKSKMFDLIAAAILITLIALSLGIIERRVITFAELGNIIIECVPFFFAAMLLNDNFYKKGLFTGKTSDNFVEACKQYCSLAVNLTGEQIDVIDDFCHEFNDEALIKLQLTYLKRASVSYERFNKGTENHEPLRIMSKKALEHMYGKERTKWILKARNAKIKGLHANTLLGTADTDDITDIGKTESQLAKSRTITSVIWYFVTTLILSFIAVKNVSEWGWFGIALVVFKCVFILCRSYMSYFDGYNDVTVHLVHNISRKIDILKQFLYWFNKRTTDSKEGNNLKNS